MLMLMVLVVTCMLLLLLVVMMLLMRLLTRGRVLLRVSQSFVVHGGVEAQLLLPGLLLLVVRVVEVREGLLARIGVGIQVCGGEVEQGVLLRVIEVLHGAWDSGFRAIYSDG